jgi:hypothetical protein
LKVQLKRRLGLTAAALVAAFAALNLLAYRQAYSMTHFAAGGPRTGNAEKLSLGQKLKTLLWGVDLPRPRATVSPASLAPACRALTFAGTNGVRLSA